MTLNVFLEKLQDSPEQIEFSETMAVIDEYYEFSETDFNNGNLLNKAGVNSGSCKLFAFAQLQHLSKEQTLACFGDFYRIDVLTHPDGTDHLNIRNFIVHGWSGISFSGKPLQEKN